MKVVSLNLENTGLEIKDLCRKLVEEANGGLVLIVEPREEVVKIIMEAASSRVSEEEAVEKLAAELNSLSKDVPEESKRVVEAEVVESLNKISEYLRAEKKAGGATPKGISLMLNTFCNTITMIVSKHFKSLGKDAKWLTAGQAGFTLIEDYELPWSHYVSLSKPEELRKASTGILVLSGRVCFDKQGNETTLRKGMGSVIAMLVANEIGVKEVYVPKANGGVYTADPSIVENARVIPSLSYAEALELSRLGEWFVSPQAVELAEELRVRILVTNIKSPFKESTIIGFEKAVEKQIVKAVAMIPDMSILTVEGAAMAGTPGVASAILGEVAKRGVSICMISQDASEVGITLVVRDADLDRALKGLREGFSRERIVKRIKIQRNVAVISAVGEGMRGTRGVAARIFSAIAEAGVNVLAIAQGSSETSVSFVVLMEDAKRAVKAVHDKVILGV
ncbi:MAG: ACT domain-containing protein [Thermoproteota archaeon]